MGNETTVNDLSVKELASFYSNIARGVELALGDLEFSTATTNMRLWLQNRVKGEIYNLDAPAHLKNYPSVVEVVEYHCDVFLTEEKAKSSRKVGIMPRLTGMGYVQIKTNEPVKMKYIVSLKYQF